MLRIYFVRHGQTEWNFIKKFQGQKDIPLNDMGRQQAQQVADYLKKVPFDVMYSSDLSRAADTADVINVHHNLPIERDSRLREKSFGCFEGFTAQEAQVKYPDIRNAYHADRLNFVIPGGESRLQFIIRVGEFLEQIHEKHAEQTVAIVAHGGVLGSMMSYIISKKLEFDSPQFVPLFTIQNCSVSQLECRRGEWLIHTLNEIHHLEGLIGEGQPVGEYA